ncbi:MAG: phosphate signaling complex protein PhoU [Proteobacteria bacterium]|jgi:phosphate transport system protein|nr:phosphate signaling complex protein PhoU [Pseudomonadota bacterium]MBT5817372.1 phosphate signaling complex protein PhoU [Pseudomonadota bacterium]
MGLKKSTAMLKNFDLSIADEITRSEVSVNEMEVDIENECLKVLALHQPVAADLRFLVVVLKVNNDLERMGGQIVNIAERVRFLKNQPRVVSDIDLVKMGETGAKMVRLSMDALLMRDSDIARKVLTMDDELDEHHARSFQVLQEVMKDNIEMIVPANSYLTISSNLERLGDLATNIAEEIIFMQEGEVIRHQSLSS